jgi:hypothetical protein
VLLPNKKTAERKHAATQMAGALELLRREVGVGAPTPEQRAEYIKIKEGLLNNTGDDKGLRVDIQVESKQQASKAEALWDVSGVHVTAPTYRDATAKFLADEPVIISTAARRGGHLDYTPCLIRREAIKHQKYSPLMTTMERHFYQNDRPNIPTFIAGIFSHAGEFGPGMWQGFEMIAMQEKSHAVSHPPRTGYAPSKVAAITRQKLQDAVACAIARGYGRLLRTCGHPMAVSKENRRIS